MEAKNSKYKNIDRLIGADLTATAAAGILVADNIDTITANTQFTAWKNDFNASLNPILDQSRHRGEIYQKMMEDFLQKYSGSREEAMASDEYAALVARARKAGVKGRQMAEFLMAEKGGDSAQRILRYQTEGGGESPYTDEQMIILRSGRMPQDEISPEHTQVIEGHHGRSIAAAPLDMKNAADPDNVKFYTTRAHLKDAHGGDYGNITDQPTKDITENRDLLLRQKEEDTRQSQNLEEIIAISMGLLIGTIWAIITYNKLKKDPMPSNRQKFLKIGISFMKGASFGIVPLVAHKGFELIPFDKMSEGFVEDAFQAFGPAAIIIFSVAIRTTLFSGGITRKNGLNKAWLENKGTLGRIAKEQCVFVLIQIAIDSFTPIPDPTIATIVTTLRVFYGVGRAGVSIHNKSVTKKKILNYQLEHGYELAIASAK